MACLAVSDVVPQLERLEQHEAVFQVMLVRVEVQALVVLLLELELELACCCLEELVLHLRF